MNRYITLLSLLACLAVTASAAKADFKTKRITSALPLPFDDFAAAVEDGEVFQEFVDNAAECASNPAPGLLFQNPGSRKQTRLASIKVEGEWTSTGPRTIDDITVVTNLDRNRLYMLPDQCASWSGPISLAVYEPLQLFDPSRAQIIDTAKTEVGKLHDEVDRHEQCVLDIVLISELRTADEAWAYPYNSARNHAVARAKTKLIMLLDVDFLISHGLREQLLQKSTWASMIHATYVKKHAYIIPAFETRQALPLAEGASLAQRAVLGGKSSLRQMFNRGDVVRFAPFYKRGHGATNYTKWFSSADPYEIKHEIGYEPYVLMSRVHVPWYDERFRGYGWDKITHIFQLAHTGFHLVVHPSGFLVHRPHPPSSAYNMTFVGPAYTKQHKPTDELRKLDRIANEMMDAVDNGTYPLRGVTGLAGCGPLDHLVLKQQVATKTVVGKQ